MGKAQSRKEFCLRGHKLPETSYKTGKRSCRICRSDSQRKWRKEHPAEAKAYLRNSRYKRLYGMTFKEYEALLEKQSGLCAICLRPLPDIDSGRYPPVDHDHVTKKVRGIVHGKCNRGIGMFDDNPLFLRRAARYLEEALCGE
jgi:hypothetical protein